MKQNITVEQLNELGKKAKTKLRKWWKLQPQVGDLYSSPTYSSNPVIYEGKQIGIEYDWEALPLLSIGQMIEFLNEGHHYQEKRTYIKYDCGWDVGYTDLCIDEAMDDFKPIGHSGQMGRYDGDEGELCDALWEAVKTILNETK